MHVDDGDAQAAMLRRSRGCFVLAKENQPIEFHAGRASIL
jgi:hypothetical protein